MTNLSKLRERMEKANSTEGNGDDSYNLYCGVIHVLPELLAVVEASQGYFKHRPFGGDEVKEALAALTTKLEQSNDDRILRETT